MLSIRSFAFSLLLPVAVQASVDFGTTDTQGKFEHTTADILNSGTDFTFCGWVYAEGVGETEGRVFVLDETETNGFFVFKHVSVANGSVGLDINIDSTTDGSYRLTTFADSAWNSVCISYDFSTTTTPVVRLNSASVTPTVTTAVSPAPSGVATTQTGIAVGNRNSQSRCWDGNISHVQLWDRILSSSEMDQAVSAPGSVTSGLRLWWKMENAGDTHDWSGNGYNATSSTTVTTDGNDPSNAQIPFVPKRINNAL